MTKDYFNEHNKTNRSGNNKFPVSLTLLTALVLLALGI